MPRTEWYKNAVVYQIYPFSFKDDNNDGWGDIAGIRSKLDYLAELGVTAIWFSPLYKSPDYDYGYDIADYRDIDPKFGTLADFQELLADCHAHGIKVIMDMAVNHSSLEHEWFKQAMADKNSPYRDYYIIREGRRSGKGGHGKTGSQTAGKLLPPTNWDSTFTGSAWQRIEGTDEFYLHLFCVEQPDLNWENPAVRQEVADIFNYWLEMGVDGFRLDVFNMFSKVQPLQDAKKQLAGTGYEMYVDGPRMHEFLQELNERAFSRYDSYTVGESYQPHEADAKRYVARESHELDTIFNFAHLDSDNMAKFFRKKFDLRAFKKGLFGPQTENYETGWNTLVLENHDNPRANSRFGIDTAKYRYEASTFLPTVTYLGFGTPFIYMGQEFGMTNTTLEGIEDCKDPVSHFIFNLLHGYGVPKRWAMRAVRYGARDHARVPMQWDGSVNAGFNAGAAPWQGMNPNYPEINLAADLAADRSVFRYYQKVIALKKASRAAVYGKPELYAADHKQIVCFTRTLADEGLLVLGNFSGKNVRFTLPEELGPMAQTEVLSNYGEHIAQGSTYTLRPYEAIVWEWKK